MSSSDHRGVDDFFAAHRDRVREHEADDQTWEAITTRARQERTRSRGMWFLGGAVAASAAAVAAVVGLGLWGPDTGPGQPAGSGGTTADVTPTPAPTDDAPAQEEPTAEPTDGTAEPTTDEPADVDPDEGRFALPAPGPDIEIFLVGEPTGEESELRAVQFDRVCDEAGAERSCPGLAVSEDAGLTWEPRVDMAAVGLTSSVAARDSIWLWGSDGVTRDLPDLPAPLPTLVRSDDAGLTWTRIDTRGTPLVVETFRSTLVVVTEGCGDDTPRACAEVVITDVATDDATTGRRLVTVDDLPQPEAGPPGTRPATRLSATYDAVYVTYEDATYRIADGEEVATQVSPPDEGCAISVAPESPDSLVSWCPDTGGLHTSADGGSTWLEVPAVEGERVLRAASTDGAGLVLATEGGVYVRSEDAWERTLDAVGDESVVLRAVDAVTLSYGGPFRYLAEGEEWLSARWTSDDAGRTWTEQPPLVLP